MTLTPVLIAPFQTGLDTDLAPWIAPPDSFTVADNVHVRFGAIEKRAGYRVFGQLKDTNTPVAITGITNANPGVVTVGTTASFANGDRVYISDVAGMTQVNDNIYVVANKTGTTFELLGINTTAFGVYAGAGSVNPVINSADRVMGIFRLVKADGLQTTIAFNTTRANRYDETLDIFLPLDAAAIMSGGVYDYVWAVNWQSTNIVNRLYFTNGKAWNGAALDGIRYYDAGGTGNITVGFRPSLGGGNTLYGGKLLFVIRQRLVVLYSFENDGATTTEHPQRATWCAAQSPSNWDRLVAGGGGFVDAPTGDHIITARQLEDSIIVRFTDSIWVLTPTPDPSLPFRWIKLNDFRSADGKMASVAYDRDTRGLGVRGITASNGIENQRIDDRIKQFTVDQINVEEFGKVYCQRSFAKQRWWTLFPSIESTENDSALVYDDESKAYTTYSINLNCLGFGNFAEDFGLDDFTAANDLDINLQEAGEDTLQDYFYQDKQETLLGGNITGTVFVLETDGSDNGTEIVSQLYSAAWNPFKAQGVSCLMSYVDLYVDTEELTVAIIEFYKDSDEEPYITQQLNFLPNLSFTSTIQGTSQTNPAAVNSAQHGLETGDLIYIYGVNGMEQINEGPYNVTVVDENNITLDGVDATAFTAFSYGGGIYKRAFYKTKIWKRAYAGGVGFEHRMRLFCGGINRPMRIHAFKPYFAPRGRTVN